MTENSNEINTNDRSCSPTEFINWANGESIAGKTYMKQCESQN